MQPGLFVKVLPKLKQRSPYDGNGLVAAILGVIFIAFAIRAAITPRDRDWFILFCFFCLFGLLLNYRGYGRLAAWIATLALCFPSYWGVLTRPGQATPDAFLARFSWLALAIVLSGLIISAYAMATLVLVNIAGMVLMTAFIPGLVTSEVIGAIGFIITLGGVLWVVVSYRDKVEAQRQIQELLRERRQNEVIRAITSALDIATILETTVRLAVEHTGADAGLISLVSPDEQRLENIYGFNLPDEQMQARPPRGQGLAWQVILTRQPIRTDHYGDHPQRLSSLDHSPLQAYLGVPILAAEKCLGALAVASNQAEVVFSQHEQDLLEIMASQASSAIQNARLYSALQTELAERGKAETTLHQREQILEAVASASGQFLQSQDWQQYIQTVLAELGQITQSSHAYIFQNHRSPTGEMVCTQLYEWTAIEAQPTLAQEEFQNVPLEGPGLERWRQAMLRAEPFHMSRSTMLPLEERYLAPMGAKSLLEMPIYLRNESGETQQAELEWWGVIGFDDYSKERSWSAAEVDAIKIAASILSAAIQRQRADQALLRREDIYRRAISSANAVPYYHNYATNLFSFIGEGVFDITGYSADEMTPDLWNERSVEMVMRDELSGLSLEQATRLTRQGVVGYWRCDYHFRTRSGELRWIADNGVELIGPDGTSTGCIGIMQDVTERKEAEVAAQAANILLEKRVQERTAELQAANQELESFAYTVSHDLRAPLRAVDGYSRLVLEDYGALLQEDGRICLENVRLATLKMNQLIEDLLKLSRVNRAEMNTSPVNLSELCEELFQALHGSEPQRQIITQVQPGLWVNGDANLLRVALSNLIDNAWKFTRHTPAASITVGGEEKDGYMVYFVRDNGAGFDMKYAERLFQAFQRLHDAREFEGTGVGLATVTRVINRHGGRIWAEGAVNQGAAFYFTLPFRPV